MFSMPGGIEWIVVLGIGLLLFGRRLPEVGHSLGRTIVEFKKGIREAGETPTRATRAADPELPEPAPSALLSAEAKTADRVAHP